MPNLKAKEYKKFEDIKKVRDDGSEYWSAREFSSVLDYTQWRNFQKVIDRAMIACENSGHQSFYDFAEVSKIVEAEATNKAIKDYELSRYACYLIETADNAGVITNEEFAIFQNTGYKTNIQEIEKEEIKRLKEKAKRGKLMLDE